MRRISLAVILLFLFSTMLQADWGKKWDIWSSTPANDPAIIMDGNFHCVTFVNPEDTYDNVLYTGIFLSDGYQMAQKGSPVEVCRASEVGMYKFYRPSFQFDGSTPVILVGGSKGLNTGCLVGVRAGEDPVIVPLDNYTLEGQNTGNFSFDIVSSRAVMARAELDGSGLPITRIDLLYGSEPPVEAKGGSGQVESALYLRGLGKVRLEKTPVLEAGSKIYPPSGLWFVPLSASDFSLVTDPVYIAGPAGVGQLLHPVTVETEDNYYITAFTYFFLEPYEQVIAQVLMIKWNNQGEVIQFTEITGDVSGGDPDEWFCKPQPSMRLEGDKLFLTWDGRFTRRTDVWYSVYNTDLEEVRPPVNLTGSIIWEYDCGHYPRIEYKGNEEVVVAYRKITGWCGWYPQHVSMQGPWEDSQNWFVEDIYTHDALFGDSEYSLNISDDGRVSITFCESGDYTGFTLHNCREK